MDSITTLDMLYTFIQIYENAIIDNELLKTYYNDESTREKAQAKLKALDTVIEFMDETREVIKSIEENAKKRRANACDM